jgi:hypothetical protein
MEVRRRGLGMRRRVWACDGGGGSDGVGVSGYEDFILFFSNNVSV